MTIEMIESDKMGPDEFGDAVSRAGGITKVAALLDTSTDSVKRWSRLDGKGVPSAKVLVVREKLSRFLQPAEDDAAARLDDLSDADIMGEVAILLAEMARRLGSSVTYGRFSTKPEPTTYDDDNPVRGTHYGNSGPPGRRNTPEDPQE